MSNTDLIQELRLRRWAREHYVSAAYRRDTWHPIVLDEMRLRDAETARTAIEEPPVTRYVPLIPGDILLLDPPQPEIPEPQFIKQVQRQDCGFYIPG